eukprot:TRINITY_DN5_c0_g1_i1.p1 TRINITY_DN5_c0_g1~~TRINITY_DN5_c0_g1_i1.p1  ORF type:complete len:1247 (+),score=307.98 TRINITY_DN5_c0_g1_i1:184-3741(+)
MALSEITVINADIMAIEEINNAGGLLGQKVVPVVKDGASDWTVFAKHAEAFTNKGSSDYVKAVFGCWTSASRKSILPVFEKADHLILYPVQYEGQECSKNIFYTGAAPNQQAEPAVDWLLRYRGTSMFLVGSDYVYPRTANEIIRGQLDHLGGKTAGEAYIALGDKANSTVDPIIKDIMTAFPKEGVVVNTLNGDSNVQFFHQYYDAGLRATNHPTMSFSITETEIDVIGVKYLVGHYASWNFFQAIMNNNPIPNGFDPTPAKAFVNNYRKKFGATALVNDPMEAAYISVKLWAQAVALAGTFDLDAVRRSIIGQAFWAAEGEVTMESNHHISKFVRLGQVLASGDFKMVYESSRAVFPEPWNTFVKKSRGYACDWNDPVNKGGFYKQDTIEVALVHALTGANSKIERQHLEAELAAIKVLNRNGGVNGKIILFQVFDTGSSDSTAMKQLSQVAKDTTKLAPLVVFGRSPNDKDYEKAIEGTRRPILFSPSRANGGHCSEFVVHTGGLVNQQLEPALKYFSKRARSAGQAKLSLYIVAPTTMQTSELDALKKHISDLGDEVTGSQTISGTNAATSAASSIKSALPNGGMVVNMLINAADSKALLQEMRTKSMTAGKYPVLLTGIVESDVTLFGNLLMDHFVTLPYFPALGTEQNTLFLGTMQEWYGLDYVVTDQVEASYAAVMAWADAANAAKSFGSRKVLKALWTAPVRTPAGVAKVTKTNYITTFFRLGTLNGAQTGFRIVADGEEQVGNPFWLEPGKNVAQCDSQLWLRLQCTGGQGIVDSSGGFLLNRQGAQGCADCPAGRTSTGLAPTNVDEAESRYCTEPSNILTIVIAAGCGILCLGCCVGVLIVMYFRRKVAMMDKFLNAKLPDNVQEILDQVYNDNKSNRDGEVCDYIPKLAQISPEETDRFGIVVCDLKGKMYKVGDTDKSFTLQSTSKVVLFMQALIEQGKENVQKKIGTEPTGKPFNDLSVDTQKKIVFNPYVNAGGICSAGMMAGDARARYGKFETLCRKMSVLGEQANKEMKLNESTYESEMDTNDTNQYIARELKKIGCVEDDRVALDAYTLACSIDTTAEDSAVMAATFANKGKNPLTGEQVIPEDVAQEAISIMISCGMYNGAGQWIVDVGVPAKSGVGGGVIGVVPGTCGFATFSPRLDPNGNSVRGVAVAEAMSKALGLHVLSGGK